MNAFDYHIITFVNQFARQSDFFDSLINLFVFNNLLKGGIVAMTFWFLWFYQHTPNRVHVRQMLLATLVGGLLAMFVARVLVHVLPFRVRPLYNKELKFVNPIADWRSKTSSSFNDVNSMPSDTATLVLALTTGILLINRRIGLLVLGYVLIFVCLPRIYIGVHNPTDILAGGLIGASCVLLTTRPYVLNRLFAPLLTLGKQYPSVFYVGLFIITYQVGAMFEEFRQIAVFLFGTH
ncbi:phosphatase PAP2 family protein [Hymenobacter sp. DG25A]|uniref:phosphatase PAP2 family protein n=1 Tax=Hymenobacter sp. DG25A TaxID=1385663 RepID=UPI0006C8DB0D|nr:phosphatase PAP2 family protein [Hymenobacter sp. DG25A]